MRQPNLCPGSEQCGHASNKKSAFKVLLLVFAMLQTVSLAHALQGAPIVFSVPTHSPDKVFVTFRGGSVTGTYYNKTTGQLTALVNETAYSLADLTSPVSVGGNAPINVPAVYITTWNSGRLYISLDTGITAPQPDSACSSNPFYSVRWMYFEPTFDGSGVHTNITYIDDLSLSYSLSAENAPNAKNNPLLSPDAKTLVTAAATAAKVPAANVLPSASAILPSPDFLRLLPPMANCAPTLPNPMYHDWSDYLKTTLPGHPFTIKGCYAGGGSDSHPETLTSQSYEYLATVDASGNITLTAQPGSGAYNAHCGGVTGTGIGSNSVLTLQFSDLNIQNGIYGGNPPFAWTFAGNSGSTSGITNNVFGWIVADLLTGLNYGFPGSTVLFNGTAIGALSSTQWWGGQMPDGSLIAHANTPGGQGLFGDKAQPNNPTNYNTYLNVMMQVVPSAYAYAFQERMGKVLLEFDQGADPNSYLLVTVNPDGNMNYAPIDLLLLNQ